MSRSLLRPVTAAIASAALVLVAVVPAAQAALPAAQAEYLVDGSARLGALDGTISDDGSKVLFRSNPDNYPQFNITVDTPWYHFLRNVNDDTLQAVGVDAGGVVPSNGTFFASLSGDGRYVTYWTNSANLGSFNAQVYRWDSVTKANVLVSATPGGAGGNTGGSASPDGSGNSSISYDGRYISFSSLSNDLVAGDTNGVSDLFVRDMVNNTTTRVLENFGNADLEQKISGDGSTIAIITDRDGLIPSDTNSEHDVYSINVATKAITLVSARPNGTVGGGSVGYYPGLELSTDGTKIMFESWATDLVAGDANSKGDVFIRNLTTSTTTLAAGVVANESGTFEGDLSPNGRFVTFLSDATNLGAAALPNLTSVFLRDLQTGSTVRVGNAGFDSGSAASFALSSVSANGRYVAFYNTNGTSAVFVRNLSPEITAGAAPAAPFGAPYSFTVTTTNATLALPSTFTVSAGTLPTGLTLNPSTGVISGNPTVEGPANFTITATNPSGTAAKAFTITVGANPNPGLTVVRLSGTDRYDTGVQISQESYPVDGSADIVWVATGANYPDALGSAAAATRTNGPLLLTPTDSVPAAVIAEINRLTPDKIYVVGGTGSVSAAAYNQLAALPGDIERIAGADRYATSRLIVQEAFPSADGAYVATGANFPDALSAGGAAGANSEPVVLLDGAASSADTATKTLLSNLEVNDIRVVGSPSSVSAGIATSLGSVATVTRVAGPSRYATSQAINARFTESDIVLLATGVNFPDALAGAAWAGHAEAPLFVVPFDCVPQAVLDQIDDLGATEVFLLGGTGTLSPAVFSLTPCAA